jgi:uncharacterized membrane protein
MYFLDPDRGARRRALARDRGEHAAHRFRALLSHAGIELRARARGAVAETRSKMHADQPDDALLVERVRAVLGHAVSHPHAIHVAAEGGCVTLGGPVLRAEVSRLLAKALTVPGVRRVHDALEVHEPGERLPALQGGRGSARLPRASRSWSPMTRLTLGALGGGLATYGVVRRGGPGLVAAGAGGAILVRAVANRSLRRVLGIGAGRDAVDFRKTFHVRAPIAEVFARFADVESFPRFMAHVREVRRLGEDRFFFTAEGPARLPVSWEAEVTERVPDRLLAWRSADGAAVRNMGVVHFDVEGDCTRVDIRLSYNPPAGALGHVIASLFGADPKHALDEDMVRFQSLLERGKTTAHHHEVHAEDLAPRR